MPFVPRSYLDEATTAAKKAVYADNVQYIDAHNALFAAGKSTFDMGVNSYTDMSHDEFKSMFVGPKIQTRNATNVRTFATLKNSAPAAAVDWRAKGAVTPVR